jgi:ketosteroid isomerase-like protein
MKALLLSVCLLTPPAGEGASDHRVRAVLAENERLEAAIASGDHEAISRFFAPEFRLQNSANRIVTGAQVLDQFRTGQTRFSGYERKVEAAYRSGEVVVLMGEERVTPAAASAPVTRRFTSVWRRIGDRWRQVARQSTDIAPKP